MFRKILKNLGIIMIVMILLFSFNIMGVLAITQEDLNNVQEKIDETKEELDVVEEELTETLKQIKSLDSEISSYENDIESLDGQIESVANQISETEEKLKKAEEKYNEQKASFEKRIVAIYEAGETTYLDVLLSSDGIIDFITNYYLVEEMAECDNNMLEQMEKNRLDIEAAKESLEINKEQIENLKANKESTMTALKNSQATKQDYANQLTDEEKELQEELEKLEAEQAEMTRQLAEAENKYSTEIAELEGSGTLQKPISGGVVTCNMYYSSGKYHGAIDWGIPSGTKVYAAEEGIVLQASWSSSGYGYMVCIQHANGLRTYYAHGNGEYFVEAGHKVERGQLIMLSGNSGNSSGPHLHFEVRVAPYNWSYGGGDSRRDPRNYL